MLAICFISAFGLVFSVSFGSRTIDGAAANEWQQKLALDLILNGHSLQRVASRTGIDAKLLKERLIAHNLATSVKEFEPFVIGLITVRLVANVRSAQGLFGRTPDDGGQLRQQSTNKGKQYMKAFRQRHQDKLAAIICPPGKNANALVASAISSSSLTSGGGKNHTGEDHASRPVCPEKTGAERVAYWSRSLDQLAFRPMHFYGGLLRLS